MFHALQAAEGHGENGCALTVIQAKAFIEASRGFGVVFGRTNDVDHFVDVIVGKNQAFHDVETIGVAA